MTYISLWSVRDEEDDRARGAQSVSWELETGSYELHHPPADVTVMSDSLKRGGQQRYPRW
jgi:hypothetical protein